MKTSWCYALKDFAASIERWKKIEGRFLILQGDNDTVVDADYNITFLQNHLTDPEIVIIPKGKHILLRYEGPLGETARGAVAGTYNKQGDF